MSVFVFLSYSLYLQRYHRHDFMILGIMINRTIKLLSYAKNIIKLFSLPLCNREAEVLGLVAVHRPKKESALRFYMPPVC